VELGCYSAPVVVMTAAVVQLVAAAAGPAGPQLERAAVAWEVSRTTR